MQPHVELFVAMALAAVWLMTKAGLSKNALELKRKRAVCPSCGRRDRCNCR